MDDEKRRLRDEVAELSRAVRELREQLTAQQIHPCFHGCTGWHHGCCGGGLHWHGYPGYTPAVTISYGSASGLDVSSAITNQTTGTIAYS